MKGVIIKDVLAIISLTLIIGTLASPNFGFSSLSSPESLGSNFWSIFVYIMGSFLIYQDIKYRSIRSNKRSKNEVGEKMLHNAFYPVFTQAEIESKEKLINKLSDSYSEAHEKTIEMIEIELKQHKPEPSQELRGLMKDYLCTRENLELLRADHKFMLEANAAVSSGNKTIDQIKEGWEKHQQGRVFALPIRIDKEIDEWIKNWKSKII